MKRKLISIVALIALLAIFGAAWAEETAPPPKSPPQSQPQPMPPQPPAQPNPAGKDKLEAQFSSSDKPVQIEADNMVVYRNEFKIVFTNRVVMKQAPTVIQTNKLTAFYREKDWEITKAVCEGDVRITREKTFAKCGRATYDNVKSLIIMEINPVIYQETHIFRGKVLNYYMNEERITGTEVRYQRNPEPPKTAPKAP